MKSRAIQSISVILPLLLMAAIFLPGAPMTPYQESPDVSFGISHESTAAFNDTITDQTAARKSAVPVDKLSESQRNAFETAKEQGSFSPRICKDLILICDEYADIPEPPSKETYMTYTDVPPPGSG